MSTMTTATTKSNLAVEQAQAARRGAAAPVHLGHDEMHRVSLTPFRTQLPTARAALQDITSAVAAACAATSNGTVNAKPPPPPQQQQIEQQKALDVNSSCAARPSAPPHQVRPNVAVVRPNQSAPPPTLPQQQPQFVSKRPLVVDDDALFASLDVDALCNNAAVSKNPPRAPLARSAAVIDNDDDVFANIDVDRVAREYQSNKGRAAVVASANAAPPYAAPPPTANFVAPNSLSAMSAPSSAMAPTTTSSAAPFSRRGYYATLTVERLTEMRNKMAQLVDDLIMSNVAARDESAE
jgi:hypothetical protein